MGAARDRGGTRAETMDTTVLARLLRSQATTQPAARPTRRQSTPGEFFGEIVKPQAPPPSHRASRSTILSSRFFGLTCARFFDVKSSSSTTMPRCALSS